MNPHPMLRQTETLALPRPLFIENFITPPRPFKDDAFATEHDFLVQNWRPDLVNEDRGPDFFEVDFP